MEHKNKNMTTETITKKGVNITFSENENGQLLIKLRMPVGSDSQLVQTSITSGNGNDCKTLQLVSPSIGQVVNGVLVN